MNTSKLVRAMATNHSNVVTENGMPTNPTSFSSVVDLFFKMGGARANSESDLISWFVSAYQENPLLAVKCAFYNRDVRGGQGERRSFRVFFKYLCMSHSSIAERNFVNVVQFGRWDDILVAYNTPVWESAAQFILAHLSKGDRLCAKWMPRENKSMHEIAVALAKSWGISMKSYRKFLAQNTSVVENLMCKNQWGMVDYNHVPSKAIHKYRKAWYKHDEVRYQTWLDNLSKPESGAKINAGAIFPHDIVKPLLSSFGIFWGSAYHKSISANEIRQIEAQWNSLPNYLGENNSILPVCDVSGSMSGLPIEVCVSLGIYTSERNKGPFQNAFVTFSTTPAIQILSGSLVDRVKQLQTAKWQSSTDLEAVFTLVLATAVKNRIPESEMPKTLVIFSDMQFNECTRNPTNSAMQMINQKYSRAGYNRPNVVFWNLRTATGIPTQYDENGTALVSGFSPSIFMQIMGGDLNPINVVLKTLNSERYNSVTL